MVLVEPASSQITTMLKTPMPLQASRGPKEAFKHLLNNIISAKPNTREAKIKPYVLTFLTHPIIKKLLGQSNATLSAQTGNSNTLELKEIQNSILQLSKAVEALRKDNASTSGKADPSHKQKARALSKTLSHVYSAAAGSRPPNPSLMVDLAHLGISSEN